MNLSFKPPILSALALSFASIGDAFLYTALPVNASQMNVPVGWIGIILSVNRFVRLVANQLFVRLFIRYGFKRISIIASVLAMLTTFMYGMATGIIMWIIVRVIWGFCFSALRISAINYAIQHKKQGFSLGISKGVQELGPVTALLAGPLILHITNIESTFIIFAILSSAAIFIFIKLPESEQKFVERPFHFNLIPSSFNFLTFLAAFFVQGILIVTITRLLMSENLSELTLTAMAGIYLAYRRICTVLISPIGGLAADKYGLDKVYLAGLILTCIGLFLIAAGYVKSGIIMAFTFNSITTALSPGNAITTKDNYLNEIASNNTWSDMGAAFGALLAGTFLYSIQLNYIYIIAAFSILVACFIHIKNNRLQIKEIL